MSQFMKLGTYDLTDKVYGSFTPTGGTWKIKQDGATSLQTGARKDVPEGTSYTFSVVFTEDDDASDFLAYCYQYNPDSPDFDEDVGADIALYIRTQDWYYRVWAVVIKPVAQNKQPMDYVQYCYDVICYLYSPYSRSRRPATWTKATITSLPETKSISNRKGHLASAIDSLQVTCRYDAAHVKNLVHKMTSSAGVITSLTLATEALTDEIWELEGNDNRLLETYEDLFPASITKFEQDTTRTGTPTYNSGAIRMAGAATRVSAYYRLSGPNPALYPVVLTADLTGTYGIVEISDDAVSWTTVLTTADFVPGVVTEYVLSGTEYMTDIYVRFKQDTATTSAYFDIASIKFEVTRWIEYGAVPSIAAGQSATAAVDATIGSESVDIDGEFYQRRTFV